VRAPTLVLEEAVVRRRGKTILGPVSLSLEPGDFLGVVGPNGAGKSTLLRLLTGRETPSEGAIRVDGVDARAMGRRSRRRWTERVGCLLQRHDYSGDVPVRAADVVGFGRVLRRPPGQPLAAEDRAAISGAIETMGMEALAERLYRDLSGGEQQKVQFARLLAQEADLLLLDEPTAGLDLDWQEQVTALAEAVFGGGRRTVVMVTHDIDRLPACCTAVAALREGAVLKRGAPAEIFTPGLLSELYGCPMEVVHRGGRHHAFRRFES
jgi:ABC-type cobalamin/Fe3+-siderophores transport system ATPase subunit